MTGGFALIVLAPSVPLMMAGFAAFAALRVYRRALRLRGRPR